MARYTLKTAIFAALAGIGIAIAIQSPAAAQPGCEFRYNPRMAESFGIQVPPDCDTPAVQAPAPADRKVAPARDRKVGRAGDRKVRGPGVRQRRAAEPDWGHRRERRRDRRRDYDDWEFEQERHYRRETRRSCSPHRAVWKASRMGLRNAHVAKIRRHRIVVAGWDHGYRARIVFAREPHCPVIAYR